MFYLVDTPWWMKLAFKDCIWDLPGNRKQLYLTFDDGPHPEATSFVLDVLKKYEAKATFFCIGKNVVEHPHLYARILNEGHRTGNHTHNHLNGWKVNNQAYLENIVQASSYIDTTLFRPPYGRISPFMARLIKHKFAMHTIMWSTLSGDFDPAITEEHCLKNIIRHGRPGKILVFHDSAKAMQKITYVLPRVIQHFSEKGYYFERINL